jgi:pyruvate kinase
VCRVIANIATEESLRHVEKLSEACEGIIIARGELGLSLGPEIVALAQNYACTKINIHGKASIVSRHMLASMVNNPRPTRAEMTDVAVRMVRAAYCPSLTH